MQAHPAAVTGSRQHRRPRGAVVASLLSLALVAAVGLDAQASSVITHGSRSRPWVALTFDDGWSADRCGQIVRTLRAKNATATFLINGSIIRGAPKRWRGLLKGFPVANHTRTHPWLTRLGTSEIRSQIKTNEQIHERILGRPMLRLLRPPYGAYDGRVVATADSLGYRTILWDTSGVDTSSGATTSSVIRNASRGGKGAIVLLHCGPAVTPAAVGPIIDRYRARGFKLVGLDQMFGGAAPPSPTACQVRNLDKDTTRGTLQRAVDAASAGDRLTVRGTCKGTTTIRKGVHIRGTRNGTSGAPTLEGKARGSVVAVGSGVRVTIRGLRIRGGSDPGGGGIDNRGDLTLRDVIVGGNTADRGGGVLNRGGAILRLTGASSIARNEAAAQGGGVVNGAGAILRLRGSSSIRLNRASTDGGGVHNGLGASLTLRDASSIRANTASQNGGGVNNAGTLRLRDSSSITGNEAASGGGVYRVAGELVGVDCGVNVSGNAPDDCAP